MPDKDGGILGRLAGAFRNNRSAPPEPQDVIPPGAPLYGSGPNFIDDSRPAATTQVGDPWAPAMGRPGGQQTHAQVIAETQYGDPRPNPVEPAAYWAKRDADDAQRHSAQQIDANGWPTPTNGTVYNPIQPIRPPSERWTSYAHPELDSFVVPGEVNGHTPYRFTGDHFSMADHRRDYQVMEQTPINTRRNTFRLEPQAWDLDLVDVPTERAPNPAGYEADSGMMMGNAYRLGG